MNIYFLSLLENSKNYCKLAQLIEKNNDVNVNRYYFLVESELWIDYIKKNAPKNKSEVIYIYENFNVNKLDSADLEKLKIYEKKYGIPNLWLYVTADRFLRRFNEKRILKVLNWHIEFYEDLFKDCKNDVFIASDVGGVYCGLMERIAKVQGVINIKIINSSLPKPSRIYISDSIYLIPNGIKERYNELLNRDLSDEELQKAKEIVDFYRSKKLVPLAMEIFKAAKINYFKTTMNIFRKSFNFFFKGISNIYTISDVIKYAVFVKKFRGFIVKTFYKKLFEEPDFKEKYFYFPLHVQPELSIDLCAPFYRDQLYLLENIAMCMPIEYKLYVKEHPGSIGIRSVKYYKRLRKITRVKLIKTDTDSYTLIDNSTVITTITGTAGWEGLMCGKPVVTFGHRFYNAMEDSVFFVKDFFSLSDIFQEIISNFKPNEEKILKICYAKYLCTYPGTIIPSSFNNSVISDENIQNLYNVIIKEINKRKTQEQ